MLTVPPLRVALAGTDGTHAADALRLLNTEHRVAGVTVVQLLAEPSAPASAPTPDRPALHVSPVLDAQVDGLLVLHRRAAEHGAAALLGIERGLPVFVDKPLAESTTAAGELIDRASRDGVALTTRSALRFHSEVDGLRRDLAGATRLTVEAPADLTRDLADLAFYGIHATELVHEVLGEGHTVELDSVEIELGRLLARGHCAGLEVRLVLRDRCAGPEGFRVTLSHDDRPDDVRDLPLDDDYLLPVLEHAAAVFRGAPPPPRHELLAPLALVEAIASRASR